MTVLPNKTQLRATFRVARAEKRKLREIIRAVKACHFDIQDVKHGADVAE